MGISTIDRKLSSLLYNFCASSKKNQSTFYIIAPYGMYVLRKNERGSTAQCILPLLEISVKRVKII